jgi:hypothetical protein
VRGKEQSDFDVEDLRARFRKMSDEELRNFGKAAQYMTPPTANIGKAPLPAFVLTSLPGLPTKNKIIGSLQMDKQALLRALQLEIQRHDLGTHKLWCCKGRICVRA